MDIVLECAIGCGIGFVSGLLWAKYVRAAAGSNAIRAAVYDGALLVPTLLSMQVWYWLGFSVPYLTGYLVGSMYGTYLGVRRAKAAS